MMLDPPNVVGRLVTCSTNLEVECDNMGAPSECEMWGLTASVPTAPLSDRPVSATELQQTAPCCECEQLYTVRCEHVMQ